MKQKSDAKCVGAFYQNPLAVLGALHVKNSNFSTQRERHQQFKKRWRGPPKLITRNLPSSSLGLRQDHSLEFQELFAGWFFILGLGNFLAVQRCATNSISVLQSFDLSPALCPSENTKKIFINPPQNVAKTFSGIPLPIPPIRSINSSEKCQCWVAVRFQQMESVGLQQNPGVQELQQI